MVTGLGCAHTSSIASDIRGRPSDRLPTTRASRGAGFYASLPGQVYARPAADFEAALSDEQRPIVEQYGRPDWVRRPFRSFQAELVNEWIYLDRAQVFQFIGGELIFQGPLTDYEQILLRHGYPDRSIDISEESGRQIDVLVYTGIFLPSLQQYYLANGKIVQMQEGN